MLSDQQFERTRRLALHLAGIELLDRHREVLERRSRRRGILDSATLDSLLAAAESGQSAATQQLLRLLTTKFTGFFRHPAHFELAAKHALRAVELRGSARLWSAGAATGEEPWSLAMALLELSPLKAPPVTILATDVDAEALAIAQRGEYGEVALQTLKAERRERFLLPASVPRRWTIASEPRRLVEFREVNLADLTWPVPGPLDVILCRNVLMYLEASRRYATLQRLASLLAPDGLLILDPTEHLGRAEDLFTPGVGGVCSLRPLTGSPGSLAPLSHAHN